MPAGDVAYLAFGALLVAALAALTVHYFSGKRRAEVEAAKYRMLDDDDR